MLTTYTFHRADDHAILETADPASLQLRAQAVAAALSDQGTVRVYAHNGRGVVAALLCRGGAAFDILRDDFMRCDGAARRTRERRGLANEEAAL